jgi:hypothetical protein
VAEGLAVSARGFEAWDEAAPGPAPAAWVRRTRHGWRVEHDGATYSVAWNMVDGIACWVAYRNAERVGKAPSWRGLAPMLPEPLRVPELPR